MDNRMLNMRSVLNEVIPLGPIRVGVPRSASPRRPDFRRMAAIDRAGMASQSLLHPLLLGHLRSALCDMWLASFRAIA